MSKVKLHTKTTLYCSVSWRNRFAQWLIHIDKMCPNISRISYSKPWSKAHQSEAAWRNTDRNGIVHRWIQWSMCRWMFQLHCWHCKLRHSDMDHSSMDQLQQKTSALLQQRKPNISPRRQHEPMGRTGLSVVTFRDEISGAGTNLKVGGTRRRTIFLSFPNLTINRFGERFRDGQYSLASFLFAVFLIRCPHA